MITNEINLLQEGRGLIRRVLWSRPEETSQIDRWDRESLGLWHIVLRLQVSKGSGEGLGGMRQDEDGGVVASRSKEQQVQNCRAQHTFA